MGADSLPDRDGLEAERSSAVALVSVVRVDLGDPRHPKLYWIDPGLARAARRRFGPVIDEERGALFEGWIATLLQAYRSYRHLFDDWHYWAPTESPALEVDFLLWRDDACIAIEAKASRRFRREHARGVEAFAESYRGKKRPRTIVVYLGADRLQTPAGTEALPLRAFVELVESDRLFG